MVFCVCPFFPQPPGKDPSQTSQTSLEPEPEPPVKPPQEERKPPQEERKSPQEERQSPSEADEEEEAEASAALRKQADECLPDGGEPERVDGVEVPEKPASETSVKTSSSDSGIEDGKSTPTSDEGKPEDSLEPEQEQEQEPQPEPEPEPEPEAEMAPSVKPPEPAVVVNDAWLVEPVGDGGGSDSPAPPTDVGPVLAQQHTRNGSAVTVTHETSFSDRASIAEDAESLAPHANGRMSKRYSDASSVDLSLNLSGDSKDMGSVSLRVSSYLVCVCVCAYLTSVHLCVSPG